VIVGGESGHGARAMDPVWVRSIRDQCIASRVRFFFKQWGGVRKRATGRALDGRTWTRCLIRSKLAVAILRSWGSGDGINEDRVATGAAHASKTRDPPRYLEAWTAILSLGGFPTIAYVDGFAGPGVYDNGEDGSPIIALKAALRHQARIKAELRFLFIEKDKERAARLEDCVGAIARPATFKVRVVGGMSFEHGFRKYLLDPFREANRPLPPTFAFIDPLDGPVSRSSS